MERDWIFGLQGVQIGLVETRTFIEAGLSWSRGEARKLCEEIILRANLSEEEIAILDKSVEFILKGCGAEEQTPTPSKSEKNRFLKALGELLFQKNRNYHHPHQRAQSNLRT